MEEKKARKDIRTWQGVMMTNRGGCSKVYNKDWRVKRREECPHCPLHNVILCY